MVGSLSWGRMSAQECVLLLLWKRNCSKGNNTSGEGKLPQTPKQNHKTQICNNSLKKYIFAQAASVNFWPLKDRWSHRWTRNPGTLNIKLFRHMLLERVAICISNYHLFLSNSSHVDMKQSAKHRCNQWYIQLYSYTYFIPNILYISKLLINSGDTHD